ncbi:MULTISPECIES: avidin/streptavidin family protein [unclassified Sinorhizobium]|uniref:avidin/streptavidin family protein n=1 Tax=unclassified Sinorhizobium TaxID=2613772 RepID=UPI0024C373BC|nr:MULTISPECIES: avidin/streptavidin family protein [unclassified Sinorhizobium]MDK1378259.1 avidin/streptavidin family protein [Sinorhizobium sp. 6-70]MDK1482450.1 avidin/streptavidin family protein [Sinorhizobium sp. 6-117]
MPELDPLTGRVNAKFIAFSVGWNNSMENCNSATGWTGYAQANGNNIEIVTSWSLAYEGTAGPAIEQGKDTFQHVPTTETKSFLND